MKCEHCGQSLSRSVYNDDNILKSCPRCSRANGQYHVFHPYPADFGTTEKRASSNSPEGAQSYCTICRGDGVPRQGKLCINVLSEPEHAQAASPSPAVCCNLFTEVP